MDQTIPLKTPSVSYKPGSLQDHHITGGITVILEVALLVGNILPLLVVLWWKRPGERTVCDKLITGLCATFIFSAVVPTPLGLVSYILGSWYGGDNTCECYQVTTTWCSLSAMALVTYMCVDRQHSLCSCRGCREGRSCFENVGVVMVLIYTITLAISTLPVIGLGPEIMKRNDTCDPWIILTPSTWSQQIYFISYLTFGYFNILLSTCSSLFLLVMLHKPNLADRLNASTVSVEEGVTQLLRHRRSTENTSWLIISLVLLLQITWFPLLVMMTCHKLGMKVSESVMMYGLLGTSLPGLLNPVLYGLLLDSYREGYRKILLKLCICCRPKRPDIQELKGVKSSSAMFTSERKRLTKVRLRDYSQIQSTATASFNPGFETDSITELVESHESFDEDNDPCSLECPSHFRELHHDGAQCGLHDNLYQSGNILPSDVMMSSGSSEDCFMKDVEFTDMGESAI